jgi:hypothetical protein
MRGREAIMKGLSRGRERKDSRAQMDQGAARVKRIRHHHVSNVLFESLAKDEARVASYFIMISEFGLDHMGRYFDRLVPVGDVWLMAHRVVSIDWYAEGSLFAGGLG